MTLRISYDADVDFLWGIAHGETVDANLADETDVLAWMEHDDGSEDEPIAWLYRRGPGGPLIGFGVNYAWEWDLLGDDADAPVWEDPRFDVPTLGLRDASVGEILLAAQTTIKGSTPDVAFHQLAVAAASEGDAGQAEGLWRCALEVGAMHAHYALGYTLVERGAPREAFGHLRAYTEISPRDACGWVWRGQAAEAMGEIAEAASSYRRAIECTAAGSFDTDAEQRLAALDQSMKSGGP